MFTPLMTDLGDEINSLLQEHRGDPDKDDCDPDEYKTPAPPRTKRVRDSNLPTFDMADLGENGDSGGDNPSDSPSDHSDDGGCDIRQDASFWAYDGFSCHIDSVLSVLAVCTTWTELETATAHRTSGAGDYLDVALRWDHDDRDAMRDELRQYHTGTWDLRNHYGLFNADKDAAVTRDFQVRCDTTRTCKSRMGMTSTSKGVHYGSEECPFSNVRFPGGKAGRSVTRPVSQGLENWRYRSKEVWEDAAGRPATGDDRLPNLTTSAATKVTLLGVSNTGTCHEVIDDEGQHCRGRREVCVADDR